MDAKVNPSEADKIGLFTEIFQVLQDLKGKPNPQNEFSAHFDNSQAQIARDVNQAARDVVIINSIRSMIPQDEQEDDYITVPIVLPVMTSSEADELISGDAFTDEPSLQEDFQRLQSDLAARGLENWHTSYRETAEDWVPFGGGENDESFKTIVDLTLNQISPEMEIFRPIYCSMDQIAHDRALLLSLRP